MEHGGKHVVSALVSKRAEIAGLITRTERQLGQFRADLVHLEPHCACLLRDWSRRRSRRRESGKPIFGSSMENCRGACSTRFVGWGADPRADVVRP